MLALPTRPTPDHASEQFHRPPARRSPNGSSSCKGCRAPGRRRWNRPIDDIGTRGCTPTSRDSTCFVAGEQQSLGLGLGKGFYSRCASRNAPSRTRPSSALQPPRSSPVSPGRSLPVPPWDYQLTRPTARMSRLIPSPRQFSYEVPLMAPARPARGLDGEGLRCKARGSRERPMRSHGWLPTGETQHNKTNDHIYTTTPRPINLLCRECRLESNRIRLRGVPGHRYFVDARVLSIFEAPTRRCA